ncbi:hypothetical protein AMAG_15433 [Allomyces macrogynus ATCC 38327]|uniref:Uncharacterized protein n=1 Tax=Allomyces macrogynus (strain ATCC 38327) TaxID=578462 RepID=A0A0L0T7K0_ALLM3|nr:hypothetical protein AMAG_15433 [Allomyces macrogynus ATCC 38327]|eukprot:KNE70676.1 hypothetical protein AMAG_15433 [Allomyces macrogynus ATCC 38327]
MLATAVAAPMARLDAWLLDEIDPLLVAVIGSVRVLAHVAAIAARRRRMRRRIAAAAAAPAGDAAAHQLLSAVRQAVDAVHHAAAAVLAAAGGSHDDAPPVDPAAVWTPRRRLRTRTASVSSTQTPPRYHRARRASAPVPSASPSPPRRRSSHGPRHALWSVDRAPWAVWLFLAWLRAVVAAWTVPVAVVAWVLGWTWWWVQVGAAVVRRAVDVCTASTVDPVEHELELKMNHGARGRRRPGPPEWDSTTSSSSTDDDARPTRRAISIPRRSRHRSKSIRRRTSPSASPTSAARTLWTSRAVAAVLASRPWRRAWGG